MVGVMGTLWWMGFLIPEEVLPLRLFLFRSLGSINRLQGIGMIAGIENLRRQRHGSRGKVLNLFQFIPHLAGQGSQFRHIGFVTPWVAADEVGDELLAYAFFAVYTVEDTFKVVELRE